MNLASVFEKDGMVTIVIAADAEAVHTESLRMSVKNWESYRSRFLPSGESGESVFPHELNEAEYDELHRLAERTEAVLEAARLLSSGDRSRRELWQKLRRKFSDEAAEAAIRLMERRGYLNEEAQCRRLAEQAVRSKHHGPRRIQADLMAHGYSEKAASAAARAIPAEDYAAALAHTVDRKFPALEKMDPAELRKATASLLRLGFPSGAILDEIRRRKAK